MRRMISKPCRLCGEGRLVRPNSESEICRKCNAKMASDCRRSGPRIHAPSEIVPCPECKTVFRRPPSESYRIFCSRKCYIDSRRIYEKSVRQCARCARNFEAKDAPKSNSAGKFCSRQCAHDAARTGKSSVWIQTPEALRASQAVARAIEMGAIIRPNSCESCERVARIYAAHHDYGQPLEVRWLCASCHSLWDRNEPKGGAMRLPIGAER